MLGCINNFGLLRYDLVMAEAAFRSLNGLFCVYKPSGVIMQVVLRNIQAKLAVQLNDMDTRPMRTIVKIGERNPDGSCALTTIPDISDHPLVVGPRYLPEDFIVNPRGTLAQHASGVTMLGIGKGRGRLIKLDKSLPLQVFHVNGKLGIATTDHTPRGRILVKSSFHHVTQAKMDRILAGLQAGHQKTMFVAAGVEPDSEEAYNLAVKGLIRPKVTYPGPVIYSMKCIDYNPPDFTLEVHMIRQDCRHLEALVHRLGVEMKTNAICTLVRRISYGHFNLDYALLSKHWDVENIIENIEYCKEKLALPSGEESV